ncbi:MAG: RdgB/HAM1 family non-canonical purine NTP pyrophosphatase [Rickettsiales bacterium]|jgi:XTP/dITP diphosphohydrolase|nr:RdgB/HAM1 family non-canonical purine NTP pyrophosphatase [Rickettsiales bacterium]
MLLLATHNAGKLAEIRAMLAPLGLNVTSAGELNIPEPEETADSFHGNAELKARACMAASGLLSLADDSGLVIPALGGAPGIYSARWAGPDKNFSIAFDRIQRELGGKKNVEAYFICVLCLCAPDGKVDFFEGRLTGQLTFPPRGEKGFGYDPIFVPDGFIQTLAEIEPAVKNKISHRAAAFEGLINTLKYQPI